ncbi:hypothetical protein Tco_1185433 [Tanacetum coccineum]
MIYSIDNSYLSLTTSRYVVPTGRVKVPAGRYVVPTGKDNVIVSTGRTNVIPAGRKILVLLLGFVVPTGLLTVSAASVDRYRSTHIIEQDLYICVAEEDMACTTSTPDNEVTYMTETEVREFNAKLEKKHVNAEMSLKKQDLQAKLENKRAINAKWTSSSKNLVKLIDNSMTVRTKIGLGLDEYIGENELGWDDFEFSVFTPTPEDVEGKPLYNRPKQTQTSDSEPKTSDLNSCESNSSVESLESMPKPVIIEPKTSEYAACKSNLSAESPEFIPKSVCARNESIRKADNPRKNNKSPRDLVICTIAVKIKERSVNSVKDTRVHTARPKTEVNTVKASASWVWKPKQEVIDHVSESHNASKTLTRYDYVDAYGRIKTVLAWDFKRH